MSDGFFSRLANLVRGASENMLKDMERENPEAVYRAAIDAQTERYQAAQSALAGLIARRERLTQDRESTQRQVLNLGEQATQAAGVNDELALQLLEQRTTLNGKLETLTQGLADLEAQIAESQKVTLEAKDQVAKLKAEKEEMLARLQAAELKNAQADLSTGMASNAADAALGNLREKLGRLEASASLETPTAAPTPTVSAKDVAKLKAQAELEALKKLKGQAPAETRPADTPADPAKPDDKGPDPLTRRTL